MGCFRFLAGTATSPSFDGRFFIGNSFAVSHARRHVRTDACSEKLVRAACSPATVRRCAGAPMRLCAYAPMRLCAYAPVLLCCCAAVLLCACALVRLCACALVRLCVSAKVHICNAPSGIEAVGGMVSSGYTNSRLRGCRALDNHLSKPVHLSGRAAVRLCYCAPLH